MRGILNILIAFLVIAIVFNYQFYYIRKAMIGLTEDIDILKDYSSMYDMQNIEEYYYRLEDEIQNREEYYIQYDDYIPNNDDILDEKIAVINFENSEISSLSEIKCSSIRTTDYYLLKDFKIESKDKVKKKGLTNKVQGEFYIGESNKSVIIIVGEAGITTKELEKGRFLISGTKQSLEEDVYKQIKKQNKKFYADNYMWVKNVYILIGK